MAITIPREVLSQYSLKARIFPNITHPEEVGILESIVSHPPLGEEIEEKWNVTPHRELDRSRASDRFVEEENEGDYPVYGGANIHQFQHDNTFDSSLDSPSLWSVDEDRPDLSAKYRVRERAYNGGTPKKDIYEAFGGPKTSKSQKGFVNDLLQEHRGQDLCMDDLLPDFTEYRIIYRDIARPTDERTMISTVLPKGLVCVHTLQTFSPYEVNPEQDDLSEYPLRSIYERAYDDKELFVITGLLNSIPFDYLMRTKVDSHIVRFKLEESQVPRLTEGDNWFHYISDRAARLNCYGEKFEEMREFLEERGYTVHTRRGDERLTHEGQVLGCNYASADVDADQMLYVGGGKFHPLGLAMDHPEKRVVIADPVNNVVDIADADALIKQRYGAIHRAMDAETWGIIYSTKIGQGRLERARQIVEDNDDAYLLTMNNVTPQKLTNFGLDAYVNTACPRITTDDGPQFKQPMLTPGEYEIAMGEKPMDSLSFDTFHGTW